MTVDSPLDERASVLVADFGVSYEQFSLTCHHEQLKRFSESVAGVGALHQPRAVL